MIISSLKKYNLVFSAMVVLNCATVSLHANNANGFGKLFPLLSTRTKIATSGVIASIFYIILKTKKTSYTLSMKNFTRDFNGIVDATKQGNITEASNLAYAFFQDYFIGREFKALEIGFEEISENGTKIKVKDSKIKCAPFGVVGLFDAYVLKQLESLIKAHTNTVGVILALANFVAISELQGAKN